MCSFLNTEAKEDPHILLFSNGGDKLTAAYVVGDGKIVSAKHKCSLSALLLLLEMYYLFEIDYPRRYAMVLALFQVIVFEEPFSKETSKNWNFFMKQLKTSFAKVKEL